MSRFYSGFQDGKPKKKAKTEPRPAPLVPRKERRQRWFSMLGAARHKAPLGTRSRYRLGTQPFANSERTYLEVPERTPYGSLDPTYKGRRNTFKVKRGFVFVARGNRASAREDWAKKRNVMRVLQSINKRAQALNSVPLPERGRGWAQKLRFLRYLTKELKPEGVSASAATPTSTDNSDSETK